MNKTSDDCLTEKHLLLFGTIIRWFARYELLMLDLTAAVAGSDTSATMILTRNLGFRDKRLALIDLLRHLAIPLDQYHRIIDYLIVPNTFFSLRNDISFSHTQTTVCGAKPSANCQFEPLLYGVGIFR